jgi:hypothetical protein
VGRVLLILVSLVGIVARAAAQLPPLVADPEPIDRLTSLERRLEALEAENARLRQILPEAPPAPETVGDPGLPPSCPTGSSPGEKNAVERFIERLGTYYDNGFVLVASPDPKRVPFELKLNLFNQLRYLDQNLGKTFTDHLGNVYPVDARNDINMNRNLYYFGGYVFDERLIYNIIIWSSNAVATVIQGGYIGYKFDKAFTLYGGYWGIPGSRSNTRDFMWLEGVDRSMADSFFRPGFTQGIWAEGQLFEHLYYVAYAGNSLNTLSVATGKIDKNFAYSGSAWWEPLGDYGPPGAARMAYSDFEEHESPAIRVGTSFTGAREDRFSTTASNPENVAIYNSDGVLFFSTGSLAPGVTVDLANFYMWALDFGFKYDGFALNGQYYFRWLNSFRADGPLPISQTFDNGLEASASYFVWPKTLEPYVRTSAVFGQFGDSVEFAGGMNWHPFHNRGFRIITELDYVDKSPTSSIQTIYNAGMTGWNFTVQTQLYF